MASNLRVDTILPSTGTTLGIGTAGGSVTFLGDTNITTSGALTAGSASITGNLGIGGTLTYEDVTNIDSVGIITARSSINVNAASSGIGVTINSGGINVAGVITATSFSGIDSDKISEGNTEVETIDTGSDGHIKFTTEGSERLRISASGLNATGVGTFSGGVTVGYDTTYSPLQQSANTWWYTRFDQSASVSGSTIVNLATGPLKISDTLPVANMTRQSFGGSTAMYNSSDTTQSVSTNMSAANPFAPKSYGLTMGTLFYSHTSGNNGSGVIHYGGNASTQHFYVRYKYNSDSILVGEDTGSSDVWTVAYQNDLMSDSNWYFLVVAIERNGNLLTSLNGAPLTPIRLSGTAPAPTDALFGLAGDPYADNASRHRYATAFWHRGVMSNELIAQEYAWLKTIWTGASLP